MAIFLRRTTRCEPQTVKEVVLLSKNEKRRRQYSMNTSENVQTSQWYPTKFHPGSKRSWLNAALPVSKVNGHQNAVYVESMHLGTRASLSGVCMYCNQAPQVLSVRAAMIRTCCARRHATNCHSRSHLVEHRT